MKKQAGLYLDVDTIERLKLRAFNARLSIGDTADTLLNRAMDAVTDEELAEVARTKAPTRGPLGGALTKAERLCLSALEELLRANAGGWRFDYREVGSKAGIHARDAYRALHQLKGRGLVGCVENPADVDRWGRPIGSYWNLVRDGQPVRSAVPG